jgi:hypothetical protein
MALGRRWASRPHCANDDQGADGCSDGAHDLLISIEDLSLGLKNTTQDSSISALSTFLNPFQTPHSGVSLA